MTAQIVQRKFGVADDRRPRARSGPRRALRAARPAHGVSDDDRDRHAQRRRPLLPRSRSSRVHPDRRRRQGRPQPHQGPARDGPRGDGDRAARRPLPLARGGVRARRAARRRDRAARPRALRRAPRADSSWRSPATTRTTSSSARSRATATASSARSPASTTRATRRRSTCSASRRRSAPRTSIMALIEHELPEPRAGQAAEPAPRAARDHRDPARRGLAERRASGPRGRPARRGAADLGDARGRGRDRGRRDAPRAGRPGPRDPEARTRARGATSSAARLVIGLIERFRDRLPVGPGTPIVSLGEGSTPLLAAPRLGAELGIELFLKLEGQNPTGSFKDRGMTLALSKALEDGARAVVCASTGNTSASAAAYAARAGLRCAVVVPAGAIALGKLAQAQACGARVVQIDGSFDDALCRRPRAGRPSPGDARQQPEPVPPRGSEDRGVRGHATTSATPRTGCACRSATAATSRPTGAASASRSTVATPRARRVCSPARPPAPRRSCTGRSSSTPRPSRRRSGSAARCGSRRRRRRVTDLGGRGARSHGRGDPRGVPPAARERGRLLRAGLGGVARGPRTGPGAGADRGWRAGRLHPHRPRAEGSGHGGRPDRGAVRCGRGLRGRRGGRARRLRPSCRGAAPAGRVSRAPR